MFTLLLRVPYCNDNTRQAAPALDSSAPGNERSIAFVGMRCGVPGGTVAANFIDQDEQEINQRSVSRSEVIALLDRFLEAAAALPRHGDEAAEVTLCLSRDLEADFLELSAFGPGNFNAQFRFSETKKLFGLVPTRRQENYNLLLHTRDEAARLVEAYMAAREPAAFAAEMKRLGAGRFRQDR